ncbi:hypothetical protein TNCV_277331 [Trichonephila clavipes]|uniref:Uncharacterized protein n=1 Tax=Trichonephila clavipes TaxID=2585209 RepID=A0A8X6S7L4_TRICX|nr:hypothetical protein TNCV_277331 [Trichonephila clavipes]
MSRQKHFPARNFAFIEKREPMNGNSSCDGSRKQCHTSTCCEMPFFKMRNERSSITGWRCPAPPGGYKSSAKSSLRSSPLSIIVTSTIYGAAEQRNGTRCTKGREVPEN